jgi:GNAT superfamily N-acetyltransferase
MSDHSGTEPDIRTAVAADLPALRQVYRAASLSNAGDAPLLLAHPHYLVFTGEWIAAGRTRVAMIGPPHQRQLVGFATVIADEHGGLELEDLFVDPAWQRRGVARRLIDDAARTARAAGHRRLSVTANPHAHEFYRAVGFLGTHSIATELGSGLRLRLELTAA